MKTSVATSLARVANRRRSRSPVFGDKRHASEQTAADFALRLEQLVIRVDEVMAGKSKRLPSTCVESSAAKTELTERRRLAADAAASAAKRIACCAFLMNNRENPRFHDVDLHEFCSFVDALEHCRLLGESVCQDATHAEQEKRLELVAAQVESLSESKFALARELASAIAASRGGDVTPTAVPQHEG